MKPAHTAWATEQRDSELLAFARNGDKPLSEGCEDLEIRYEEAFAQAGAPAGDLLTPQDYAACQVVPVPDSDPDRGLQIGRAHVCTPVTNAHIVCRLLLDKKQ